MSDGPKEQWRLETNDRYREVVRTMVELSTAALVVPVFLVRNVFNVPLTKPILYAFTWQVYVSWVLLSIAVLSGIVFHYFSAKWVRMAWRQKAGIFRRNLSEDCVEEILDWTFWVTAASFVIGVGLTMWFFVTYVPGP